MRRLVRRRRPSFKAATWNVFHGTPLVDLEPILKGLLRDGVTVFLMQEGSRPGLIEMLRRHGLRVHFHPPQYVVAWVPLEEDLAGWAKVSAGGGEISKTRYARKGGSKPIPTEAAWAVLSDGAGRTLEVLSYHTPAHVQVRADRRPTRRMRALVEAMAWLAARARTAQTRAVLYGGDDNVDEPRAFARTWRFMLRAATGLQQVVAPAPTHGHRTRGRRIDDFRELGLIPGEGEVLPGGGDHRIHVREFYWRRLGWHLRRLRRRSR